MDSCEVFAVGPMGEPDEGWRGRYGGVLRRKSSSSFLSKGLHKLQVFLGVADCSELMNPTQEPRFWFPSLLPETNRTPAVVLTLVGLRGLGDVDGELTAERVDAHHP